MKNKIVNISKIRNKKRPRSPENAAEAAARTFLDKIPPNAKEPDAFASGGDMSKINEDKENEDD
jgi:hypothetical protein